MSINDYNIFKNRLLKNNKEILEDIYNKKYEEHKQRIIDGIENDQRHNKMINFCINCFQRDGSLYNQTGYVFVYIDPLYNFGIKNFDIAIFNEKNKGLLLVECKSKISNYDEVIDDIQETINDTYNNKHLLDNYFGSLSFIDFVLCVDAVDARDVVEKIIDNDAPICTWGCSFFRKQIKLFKSDNETHLDAISAKRMHGDENISRILYKGFVSIRGTESTLPIFPSSHMLAILRQINMTLIESLVYLGLPLNSFGYVKLNEIMQKEMTFTTFNFKQVDKLTQKMVNKSLEKSIYSDETEDLIDTSKKKFRFSITGKRAMTILKNIEKNYIELNAMKRAKLDAVSEYKKRLGITTLDNFIKREP